MKNDFRARGAGIAFGVSALLLGSVAGASAANLYIAPDGSDLTGSGTIDNPYETIIKAQEMASSGDTVYLRGGTYTLDTADITYTYSAWKSVNRITKNGISYVAYADETPVFDFSGVRPDGYRVTAFLVEADNCVFKGFEVVGVQVTIAYGEASNTQSECFRIDGGNGNRFERLSMHDGMGIGWYLTDGANNLVLNCDAYNNKGLDALSDENIDGFGCHPRHTTGTGNRIVGCRAWYNADDGYDLINAQAAVSISNCWAMYNGYDYEATSSGIGNGNGFKAGGYGVGGASYPTPVPRHSVSYCVSVGNRASGFYANHHTGGLDWIGNTAIHNISANFNMLCSTNNSSYDGDVAGFDQYMKNNLSYLGTLVNMGSAEANEVSYNSWTLSVSVSSADFESLTESQLVQARASDGSLPEVDYGHLAEGSDLIDAGLDLGVAFAGDAPDLGAFESGVIEVTNPPVQSTTVELSAVADTALRYNGGANGDQSRNYGTETTLYLRQLDGAPRDYFVYVRFDLSSITAPITDATFEITQSSGDTLSGDNFRVLGLDAVSGNTSQSWGETVLSCNALGAEFDDSIYPSSTAGESPFDASRVTDFEAGGAGVSETIVGSFAMLSGSALTEWLETRRNDGGLATLIIDYPTHGNTSDGNLYYYSREAASDQPKLTLTYGTTATTGYTAWIEAFPNVGVQTNGLDDADGDGVNNLGEYGLGGDPSLAADSGAEPFYVLSSENGGLFYVYPQREDATDLVYTLERATDLVAADWTNAFYEVTGTGVWSSVSGFLAVTNRLPFTDDSAQFLRLSVQLAN